MYLGLLVSVFCVFFFFNNSVAFFSKSFLLLLPPDFDAALCCAALFLSAFAAANCFSLAEPLSPVGCCSRWSLGLLSPISLRFLNLAGAVLGGLLLGLIESLGGGYLGDLTGGFLGSHYQDVLSFGVLVLVLIIRPSGILGERVSDRS